MGARNHREIAHSAIVAEDAVLLGNVTVREGATISNGAIVGALSSHDASNIGTVTIGEGVFIGARSIIGAGVSIGSGTVVRPGTVLFSDAPPMTVVAGNPGYVVGYVSSPLGPISTVEISTLEEGHSDWVPEGVELVRFPRITDLRGALTICEHADFPFEPVRSFFVSDVAPGLFRGAHAHKECTQLLLCVQGSVSCMLDDRTRAVGVRLNRPDIGLLVPPMVWAMQYQFAPSTVLAVYASHRYDRNDYIDLYDDFIGLSSCSKTEAS